MKTIVTTSFDDGHKLDLKLVKLIKKYNLKSTFYVSPFSHEFPKAMLLNEKDLKILSNDVEIGAHTLTHPHLDRIPIATAEEEIYGSKQYLEQIIEKEVISFCYPYGDYNVSTVEILKRRGFKLARTTKRYSFSLPNNPFELRTTFHMYNHFSDIHKIVTFSDFNILKLSKYASWDNLAIALFNKTLSEGGVFHLWGHSWEYEKFNTWEKLERVLAAISNNNKVEYKTNSELLI